VNAAPFDSLSHARSRRLLAGLAASVLLHGALIAAWQSQRAHPVAPRWGTSPQARVTWLRLIAEAPIARAVMPRPPAIAAAKPATLPWARLDADAAPRVARAPEPPASSPEAVRGVGFAPAPLLALGGAHRVSWLGTREAQPDEVARAQWLAAQQRAREEAPSP
jgi:hypothetical protein